MHYNQRTIKKAVQLHGIGVHSGKQAILTLEPLSENEGVVFQRSDLEHNNTIQANISNVADTKFCTTIANEHDVTLSTVEHLMAALAAFQINNILIKVNQAEIPIMDGSSEPFIKAIQSVGITEQNADSCFIKVLKPIIIEKDDRWVKLEPSHSLSFDLTMQFYGREGLADQKATHHFSNENFIKEISQARSFGFLKDAEKLYSMGLAKGSSLDNAVVINNGKVMNDNGLRYNNEMVKHKILDAVGDFYLAGLPLIAHCSGVNTGHELNNLIMIKLLSDPLNYKFVNLTKTTQDSFDVLTNKLEKSYKATYNLLSI